MLNFSFMKLGGGGFLSKKLSFSRLLIVTNSNNSSLPISNFKIWRKYMNMTKDGIGWGPSGIFNKSSLTSLKEVA